MQLYNDLFLDYLGPGHNVRVYDNDLNIIEEQPPNPARFRLEFGKHNGKLISEIKDDTYLEWLEATSTDHLLLRDCVAAHRQANE